MNKSTRNSKQVAKQFNDILSSFMDYDLGYFDERGSRVEPVDDPFGFEKV